MLSCTDPLWNNLFPAFLSLVASKSLDQNFFTSSHTKMSIYRKNENYLQLNSFHQAYTFT